MIPFYVKFKPWNKKIDAEKKSSEVFQKMLEMQYSKIHSNQLVYIHITNCINGKKHWFNLNLFIEIDLLLTIILGCVIMMIL